MAAMPSSLTGKVASPSCRAYFRQNGPCQITTRMAPSWGFSIS